MARLPKTGRVQSHRDPARCWLWGDGGKGGRERAGLYVVERVRGGGDVILSDHIFYPAVDMF